MISDYLLSSDHGLAISQVRPLVAKNFAGEGWVNSLATAGGGAFSRSLAAAVLCPVTVVKTRMEYAGISGVKYSSTAAALIRFVAKLADNWLRALSSH
eukprot:9025810-Pyramimonas_sp.AAC.1